MFESFLEPFSRLPQLFVFLEEVKVGKNAHDVWEAVALEEGQELECFHFEAERCVDDQDHHICNFREVDHRGEVVGTLDQSDSLLFGGAQGDGP